MKILPADGGLQLGRELFSAIGHTDAASVRTWVDAGARLDLANPEGITTLMCACAGGNAEIVKILLQSGSNVALEAKDSHGWTALITAAHRGDAKMLEALLGAGADVRAKDKMDRDVFYYAKSDPEKMKVLQKALADDTFAKGATVLQQPVAVKKPLQYKP